MEKLKKKRQKTNSSKLKLAWQTCESGCEIEITPQKANKKNYNTQFPIIQIQNDEINEKSINKKDKKTPENPGTSAKPCKLDYTNEIT